MTARRALAVAAALLGLGAPFAGELPIATTSEPEGVAPLDLAEWIRDRKPDLRVVDLRSADAFELRHLPNAESLDSLLVDEPKRESALFDRGAEAEEEGRQAAPSTAGARVETVVVYSDDDAEMVRAARRLGKRGGRNVLYLRGGWAAWQSEVMYPVLSDGASPAERADQARASELSRYFGGRPRKVGPTTPKVPARPRGC
jgi:rhodanese-related sulfurtransferase